MKRELLPIADWQQRISDHFSQGDVVGGSLLTVMDFEKAAGAAFITKYVGHRYLSDASQGFFFDTLRHVTEEMVSSVSKIKPNFALIFVDLIMIFRRIRAASELSTKGYTGASLILLRDVKDRCMHFSALFQNIVAYDGLMGISDSDPAKATSEELDNLRRRRRVATEKAISDQFLGAKSGMSIEDQKELGVWSALFDRETHGSFLSSSRASLDWLRDGKPLTLVSIGDEMADALYMNRFCEVCWMYHRLMPALQSGQTQLNGKWAEHWCILDTSFWQMQKGLAELGKPIGDSFIRFIDAKFPFDPNFRL
jgi:hypothetical protein